MVVFYMVNSSDQDIVKTTWRTIGNGLSIFAALLIFKCLKDLTSLIFYDEDNASLLQMSSSTYDALQGGGTVSTGKQIFIVIRFVLAFLFVEFMMYRYRARKLALAAFGLMGAHVVGFMGGECFGVIQMQEPFKESACLSFVVVIIGAASIGLMMLQAKKARTFITEADGSVDDHEHNFEHSCEHSENEFFSFAVGLLITQFFRHLIVGKPCDFHGPQFNNDSNEIYQLLIVALCFGIGVLVFDVIGRYMARQALEGNAYPMGKRAMELLEETCAMTMGWSLLFFGKWWFWYTLRDDIVDGDIMTGQMYMAVGTTLGSFALVVVFDFLSDRLHSWGEAIRALIQTLEMLIGLTWESVFVTAIELSTSSSYTEKLDRVIHDFEISIFLCILVIPAWAMYIMPRGLPEHEHGEHGAEGEHEKEKGKEEEADSTATPLAGAAAPIGDDSNAAAAEKPAPAPAPEPEKAADPAPAMAPSGGGGSLDDRLDTVED